MVNPLIKVVFEDLVQAWTTGHTTTGRNQIQVAAALAESIEDLERQRRVLETMLEIVKTRNVPHVELLWALRRQYEEDKMDN